LLCPGLAQAIHRTTPVEQNDGQVPVRVLVVVKVATYFFDANGNVTALINTNQVVVARYLYDPFGNLLASSGGMADINLYRFSSKEAHENSGLVYYGYRFYEPRLQRWLNQDPLMEEGGINMFRFSAGDPVNRIDPWGELEVSNSLETALRYGVALISDQNINNILGYDYAGTHSKNSYFTYIPDEFANLTVNLSNYQLEEVDYAGDVLKAIHGALGVAGTIDPTGLLDGADGLLYFVEGDFKSAAMSATAILPGGDLLKITKLKNVGEAAMVEGKVFTQNQKREILKENRLRNGGDLRSDLSGAKLVPSQKSQKGVTPPPNEAQIDHIYPRSKGGPNTTENAQVLSRKENRLKSDNLP
jgi:RHS repeat-associated protein